MRGDNDRSAVSTQCTSAERAVRLLLPLAVCFLCFIWSLRLPVEMAPDESMRLMIPFYIVEHGRLPIGSDPAIRNSIWGTSYGFVPYTPHSSRRFLLSFLSFFQAM